MMILTMNVQNHVLLISLSLKKTHYKTDIDTFQRSTCLATPFKYPTGLKTSFRQPIA